MPATARNRGHRLAAYRPCSADAKRPQGRLASDCEDCEVAVILRRAARGIYWIGLLTGPVVATVALIGAAYAAAERFGGALDFLPLICIGLGAFVWVGLIWVYRTIVPLPCVKCGGVARATSLDPITVWCRSCGYTEVSKRRIVGAP